MDGLHYNAVCLVGLSRLPNFFPPRRRTSHLFSPRIRGIFITFCLRNYDHQNTFKCKSKWDAGALQLIIATTITIITIITIIPIITIITIITIIMIRVRVYGTLYDHHYPHYPHYQHNHHHHHQ